MTEVLQSAAGFPDDVVMRWRPFWNLASAGFSHKTGGAVPVFNHATCGQSLPTYLSGDHDRFHQWANLRILNIRDIKTVP